MQVWWNGLHMAFKMPRQKRLEGSNPSTCTRNSCPAKLCNDCGEAKALADKGQPHELEYGAVV